MIYDYFISDKCAQDLYKWYTGPALLWDITCILKFGTFYTQLRLHFFEAMLETLPPIVRLRGGADTYKKVVHPVQNMGVVSRALVLMVTETTNHTSNAVFRSGQPCARSYMGFHADNEPLYDNRWIADVSLGPTTRIMVIAHKYKHWEIEIPLTPGSLMVMRGDVQQYFVHKVLRGEGPRIGLVFRDVRNLATVATAPGQPHSSQLHFDTWPVVSKIMKKHLSTLASAVERSRAWRAENRHFGASFAYGFGHTVGSWDDLTATGIHMVKRGE